jgi:kumamolisin
MTNHETDYQPIEGSGRGPAAGARRVGNADPDAPVEVTVVLKRPERAGGRGFAADPAAVDAVEDFAHEHGLTVTFVNEAARSVGLSGTVAQMNAAFQVDLGVYERDGATYRGREGEVHVPSEIAGHVRAVLGLDNRRQARAHFRTADVAIAADEAAAPNAAPRVDLSGMPPQVVAQRYNFPTDADGEGKNVAIIELGGGYDRRDLRAYFEEQGLKMPRIRAVSVDGARNSPGDEADAEVALDIEVVGAIAQGAHQSVYFAPNTGRGFFNAIAKAIHSRRRPPCAISISWGGPESSWTAQAMDAYDDLFADAAAMGIPVFCSAGDDGATDRSSDNSLQVDFPASSPNVVACGGTRLTDEDEEVWNDLSSGHGATGGGVSRHFDVPAYQSGTSVPANPDGKPGRGVPDVAGDADPLTGYVVRVGGRDQVIGGTSAVSPLWAALIAIAASGGDGSSTPGDIHDLIYAKAAAAGAFRDVVRGDNGHYQAGPGWDACTGNGSPDGQKFAEAYRQPA